MWFAYFAIFAVIRDIYYYILWIFIRLFILSFAGLFIICRDVSCALLDYYKHKAHLVSIIPVCVPEYHPYRVYHKKIRYLHKKIKVLHSVSSWPLDIITFIIIKYTILLYSVRPLNIEHSSLLKFRPLAIWRRPLIGL